MLAMQYTVKLPFEFDREKAAARVARRSGVFGDLEGLIHKSYLYNEKDRLYAPFYVWSDSDAARAFLFGDLFRGVVQTFGRPRVRLWHVIGYDRVERGLTPNFACYEIDPVEREEKLVSVLERERETHQAALEKPGLYAHVTALDPDRWELARFSLWSDKSAMPKCRSDCIQSYSVLKVCEPRTHDI